MSIEYGLRRTEVTLKMLIDRGILTAGIELGCDNIEVRGILNQDGSITIYFKGEEKTFGYLSGAARYIEDRSLNGWKYWFLKSDSEKRPLEIFREQYFQGRVN